MEVKVLKCENCGSILEQTNNKEMLFCPYCGAKTLMVESDAVKIKELEQKTAQEHERTVRMVERFNAINQTIENLKPKNEGVIAMLLLGGLLVLVFILMALTVLLF